MMPNPDDFRRTLYDSEQRLSARLSRVEETLYGDGKANQGLVADVKVIADTLIGQKWRDYAFALTILLEIISLFLIGLLFIRVY